MIRSIGYRCALLMLLLCLPKEGLAQWKLSAPGLLGQIGGAGRIHYCDGVLWAGCTQLFMSLDSGKTWTSNQSFPGNFIVEICFLDRNTGIISSYGSNSGFYLTTDQGASWTLISLNTGSALAFDGTANDILLADFRINSTRDQGAHWSSVPAAPTDWFVNFIGRHNGSAYLLQGSISSGSKIMVTTDYGATWQKRAGPLPTDCYSFTVDSCDPNRMYLMHEDFVTRTAFMDNNTSDVFGTSDGGVTWTNLVSRTIPFFAGSIENGRSALYAQTMSEGIYRSTDQGATWKSIAGPSNGADTKMLCVIDDNIIIAADSLGSVFRTTNSGNDSVIGKTIGTLAASPSTLFIGDTMTTCDAPLAQTITLVGHCSPPHVSSTHIVGTDSASYSITQSGSGMAGDSIVVTFKGNVGKGYQGSLIVDLSDGSRDTVSLNGFVKPPLHIALSTHDMRTDTIGGDLFVPIILSSDPHGMLSGSTIELTVNYDSSELRYRGSYLTAGGSLDEPQSRWPGHARVKIEGDSLPVGDSVIGYAKFNMFPVTDSCASVIFDSLSIQSKRVAVCSVVSPGIAQATLCFPVACGTHLIASQLRYGHVPNIVLSPNPAKESLRLCSSITMENARIELFDMLGTSLYSQEGPIIASEPYILNLAAIRAGTYYLRISSTDFVKSFPLIHTR